MDKEEWKVFEKETLNPIIINSIKRLASINEGYDGQTLGVKEIKVIQENISLIIWLSEKL